MSGLESRNSQRVEVECHSGFRAEQYPKRVNINGGWYDIFEIIRHEVIEDYGTRERSNIYYCHIGDNIIVKLVSDSSGWRKI